MWMTHSLTLARASSRRSFPIVSSFCGSGQSPRQVGQSSLLVTSVGLPLLLLEWVHLPWGLRSRDRLGIWTRRTSRVPFQWSLHMQINSKWLKTCKLHTWLRSDLPLRVRRLRSWAPSSDSQPACADTTSPGSQACWGSRGRDTRCCEADTEGKQRKWKRCVIIIRISERCYNTLFGTDGPGEKCCGQSQWSLQK